MEHEVYVPFPVGTVRQALAEPERVARCVPGAQLDADSDPRAPEGRLRVRISGSTITYRGTLRVAPRGGEADVFAVDARGTEARGDGFAEVALTVRLAEAASGDGTTLRCDAELRAEGRLADAADPGTTGRRLLDRFAQTLASDLTARPVVLKEDEPVGPEEPGESEEPERSERAAEPGTSEGSEEAARGEGRARSGGPEGIEEPAQPQGADRPGDADALSGAVLPEQADAEAEPEAKPAPDAAGDRTGGDRGDRTDAGEARGDEDAEAADEGEAEGEGGDEDAFDVFGDSGAAGTDDAEADGSADDGDDVSGTPPGGAPHGGLFDTEIPPPSLDPLSDDELDAVTGPPAEAAHARRTMIGRSAEEVDHAPPRGRYAPVPAPETASSSATLRWAAPAAAVVIASAVVVGRALRRRR